LKEIGSRALYCPVCDALQSVPILPPAHRARCHRCRVVVARGALASYDVPLALCVAALILWAVANGVPFLGLEYGGIRQTNFVVTGAVALWTDGEYFLGLLVAFTSIVVPAAQLGLGLHLLLALRRGRKPWNADLAVKVLPYLAPWSMLGVFLIGVCVAAVKLGQLASLTPGPGLYAFAGLVLLWTLASSALDPRVLQQASGDAP